MGTTSLTADAHAVTHTLDSAAFLGCARLAALQVKGIAAGNQLGAGIVIASDPALGPGGSWSTCLMGCNASPPADVAHLQFKAHIAFKLVW